jgi:hypothetical protein
MKTASIDKRAMICAALLVFLSSILLMADASIEFMGNVFI